MKPVHYTLSIICLVLFISCGQKNQDDAAGEKDSSEVSLKSNHATIANPRLIGGEKDSGQVAMDEAMKNIAAANDPVLGNWVGDFGKNKINLILCKHNQNFIEGFSVCAGNYRTIKGSIKMNKANPHEASMTEPGDDQYDGTFDFTIDTEKNVLKGKWIPFKAKGNAPKTFTLEKKEFVYSTTHGDYPKASQELLTEADVENLNAEELEVMRNEIYARHGYSFKNKKMRYYFEEKDWYMPMGIDVRDELTDIEAKNIELIYRYEEYYKTNYDNYGR